METPAIVSTPRSMPPTSGHVSPTAVTALPEGERDALLLFVWEELGYDEIAAALDVPVGTVRSRLNRARMRIRELDDEIGREV